MKKEKVDNIVGMSAVEVIVRLNGKDKSEPYKFKMSEDQVNTTYFRDNFPIQCEGWIENDLYPFGESDFKGGVVYCFRKPKKGEDRVNDFRGYKNKVREKRGIREDKVRVARGDKIKVARGDKRVG